MFALALTLIQCAYHVCIELSRSLSFCHAYRSAMCTLFLPWARPFYTPPPHLNMSGQMAEHTQLCMVIMEACDASWLEAHSFHSLCSDYQVTICSTGVYQCKLWCCYKAPVMGNSIASPNLYSHCEMSGHNDQPSTLNLTICMGKWPMSNRYFDLWYMVSLGSGSGSSQNNFCWTRVQNVTVKL